MAGVKFRSLHSPPVVRSARLWHAAPHRPARHTLSKSNRHDRHGVRARTEFVQAAVDLSGRAFSPGGARSARGRDRGIRRRLLRGGSRFGEPARPVRMAGGLCRGPRLLLPAPRRRRVQGPGRRHVVQTLPSRAARPRHAARAGRWRPSSRPSRRSYSACGFHRACSYRCWRSGPISCSCATNSSYRTG